MKRIENFPRFISVSQKHCTFDQSALLREQDICQKCMTDSSIAKLLNHTKIPKTLLRNRKFSCFAFELFLTQKFKV